MNARPFSYAHCEGVTFFEAVNRYCFNAGTPEASVLRKTLASGLNGCFRI